MKNRAKPLGDQYQEALDTFKEVHNYDHHLLKEVDDLMHLLSLWHIQVFMNITQEKENIRVKDVEEKLDERFGRFS